MSQRPLRALIVEDVEADALLLLRVLTRGGYAVSHERVETAEGLGAALDRGPWDIIFSDYSLPGLSAPEALERVSARGLDVPFIIISGTVSEEIAVSALRSGACDFMSKGKLGRLIPAVERELKEAVVRRENARMVKEVAQAREHLEALLRSAPAFIISADRSGRIQSINRVLSEHEAAEVLGSSWLRYIPEEDHARVQAVLEGVVSDGVPRTYEVSHLAANGQRIWFSSVMGPIRHGDEITGVVVIAQDITELKHGHERLRVSDRMACVGGLAAGVAHDFNNILAAILSFATFARDALPDGSEPRQDLEEVLAAASRAVGLIRQLATFARQQPKERRPTDLNERLSQLSGLLVRTVGAHIRLSVQASPRPTVVSIDPVEFDQVVLNLVVNARDAMPNGGRIDIVLEHLEGPPASARLRVTDSGVGMDERTRLRIFEPFFTTKEPGKGTGLGLATCYTIVEESGGSISVESAPGRGSTFEIVLPLSAERPAHERRPERSGRSGHGELILLAEDEPALRAALTRTIERAGYAVLAVEDGAQAIAHLDAVEQRIDLILSDVLMPGRTGHEVAAHAARVRPRTPVLLTTGYQGTVEKRAPEVRLLWKPVPEDELLRAIDLALSDARSAREAGARELALVVGAPTAGLAEELETAGFLVQRLDAGAARAALEAGSDPRLLLCASEAEELLRWLIQARPALCHRVRVFGAPVAALGERFGRVPEDLRPGELLRALLPRPSDVRANVTADLPAGRRKVAPPHLGPRATRPLRALVVDDDAAILRVSSRILRGAGFEILQAHDVAEALAIIEAEDFDVLVADIGLPDGSGLDLLPSLKGDKLGVPAVIVTATPSVETAAQAVRSRVFEYVSKPVSPDQLVAVVRSAADHGIATRLRDKLLAARFGGDELIGDLAETERRFQVALGRVRMVYQPIVRARDGTVYGYEALLRSDEPSLASPARLLAAAEVLGRVTELGRAVRGSVARTILEHRDRVEPIFVNVHPAELRADLLGDSADPLVPWARRVVLEVTERASLEGTPQLGEDLSRLRSLGYRLAVDDLGEGYAGLTSLVHVRPDLAKLDMSLIRDVHRAPLKQDIIAAVVDVARRSNIAVIAEGIETIEERDTVVSLGCDLLQGYLYARPGAPFPAPQALRS